MNHPVRRQRGLILLPVVIALTLIAVIATLINRDSGMNATLAARGLQADGARYVAEAGLAQMNYRVQAANCAGYPTLANVSFGSDQFNASVTPTFGTPVTLTATSTTATGATATLTRANIVAHQTTPYVLTLQPGPSGMDTYVETSSGGSKNYGASDELKIDGNGKYSLLQFDLSAIPATAVIQSAQLMVYKTGGGGGSIGSTVTAYRLTRAWTEGSQDGGSLPIGANWNTSNGLAAWSTPGGDYDSSSAVTAASTGTNSIWMMWDITTIATNWVTGASANNGIILVPSASVPGTKFISGDDASNSSQWPKLVVTFLPPCAWVSPIAGTILGPSADARLREANTAYNYGASSTMALDGSSGDRNRSLVRFDLSSVPPGTKFKTATLRLYVNNVLNLASSTLSVYRVTEDWTEGTLTGASPADGATWLTRDGVNTWSAAGGSSSGSAADSANIGLLFLSGWVEFDITSLAQAWFDGVSPNYGIQTRISTTANVTINTREASGNQPQLVLTW